MSYYPSNYGASLAVREVSISQAPHGVRQRYPSGGRGGAQGLVDAPLEAVLILSHLRVTVL